VCRRPRRRSVIRCCQTTFTVCGTTGTSGTCGTSFRVLREHRVLQVHGHCNLIGNAKQHHNAYQALVFVIRLPNNIPRRHCAYFDKIKNPRISTRALQDTQTKRTIKPYEPNLKISLVLLDQYHRTFLLRYYRSYYKSV